MFAVRYFFYLLRLWIYWLLGLFRFFAKPGSRLLVPLQLIAIGWFVRPQLHEAIADQARRFDAGYMPESGLLDAASVVVVLLAILAYVIVSKMLAVTLGAFPVAMRPLRPLRRMKATETKITSAVVRIVVPALPKKRG